MAMEVDGDTLHGVYWFDDVPPDTYELSELVPAGFEVTEPPETMGPFGPVNSHVVVLLPGEQEEGVNFGNAPIANLFMVKKAPSFSRREEIVYTLRVTSNGDSPNTVVKDTLHADLEYISATTTHGTCSFSATDHVLTCNLGTVKVEDDVIITIRARPPSSPERPVDIINRAWVKGDYPDIDLENNHSEVKTSFEDPNLIVEKEVSSQTVEVGDRITYTIIVKRRASIPFLGNAKGIELTDRLPDNVEFVSASVSGSEPDCRYDPASRVVTCEPISVFEVNRPDTVRVEVEAVREGTFPNIATAEEMEEEFVLDADADTVEVTITEADPTPTEPDADLPDAFVLYDNYPNPFNPETEIRFDVPHRARLRLEVVDVLGRVVTTLVDQEMPPGRHHAVFEARGLPSGVYFYRITAGVFRETRSMILLK